MHVVITGGTGLIGRSLARYLLARGHTVTVFTRRPQTRPRGLPERVRLAAWSLQPEALAPVLEEADAVVNLVGANISQGRWTQHRKAVLYHSRVDAGRALSETWKHLRRRPAVLLQMSAVGYYGSQGDRVLDEEAPPGTDFLAQLCVDWEAATRSVEDLGTRRVVMRTGVVLSREGGALPLLALPVRLGVGGPLGDGRFYIPWIHIQDVVAAMTFFLENSETQGAYNLTAPNPVPNTEFVRTLGRVLRRPVWLRVPVWAMRLVLGELADALVSSIRAVPRRLLEAGFSFAFSELEPALRDLFG